MLNKGFVRWAGAVMRQIKLIDDVFADDLLLTHKEFIDTLERYYISFTSYEDMVKIIRRSYEEHKRQVKQPGE